MRSPTRSTSRHRLADVPLFASLAASALDGLASESRRRQFAAGQVLWHEGDPGEALLVLEEGQLRVTRVSGSGVEVVLAVIDAPAALGELALLDGAPRDASVIAQRAVSVRFIPRGAFLALLRREPAVVEGLLHTLAGMVRAANARHLAAVSLDVPGRLAAWLLGRLDDARELDPQTEEFSLDRSQGELAAELGTTRSTLNRALNGFNSLGYLSRRDDQIVIHNRDGLLAHTEDATASG